MINWEAVKRLSVVGRAGVLFVPWGKNEFGPISWMIHPTYGGEDVVRELSAHVVEIGEKDGAIAVADYVDQLVLKTLLESENVSEIWKSQHHDWVYPMLGVVEEANAELDSFILPADDKTAPGLMAGKVVFRSPHINNPVGGMWSDIILHRGCVESEGKDGSLTLFLDCFIRHPAAFAKVVDK